MPKFAPNEQIVEAFYFNGDPQEAVKLAQSLGAQATMTFTDAMRLSLDDKPVPADSWVFKGEGGAIRVIDGETFSNNYTAVGVKLENVSPRAAPKPVDDAAIRVGDLIVTDECGPDDQLEVMEIDGDVLICDGVWGQKTIPIVAARLLRRP